MLAEPGRKKSTVCQGVFVCRRVDVRPAALSIGHRRAVACAPVSTAVSPHPEVPACGAASSGQQRRARAVRHGFVWVVLVWFVCVCVWFCFLV